MIPFVFDDGVRVRGLDVNYALDVPMYFVYRDGIYIDALGHVLSRLHAAARLPALPGETPTLSRLGGSPDHGCSPKRG